MEEEDNNSVVEKKEEQLSLEEHLSSEKAKPTKLNKNGKPRKQLSEDSLLRLAKAREKANAMRQQAYAKKLEEKVKNLKEQNPVSVPSNEEPQEKELKEEPQEKELKQTTASLEHPLQEEEVEIIKEKPRGKKKTKIIVEQSSDDSDEFEPNDNVVFVKRVSRRGKRPEPAVEPPIERQQGMELPPSEPPRPPRPQLTPEQRILKSQYEGMFSGGFMNQANLMRRHY